MSVIHTQITELFGITHPVILAGMNVAAGPKLAAAVANAGGLGVIGGVRATPKHLRRQIQELKAGLNDKKAPFGVDLLLPQVGGSARATNKAYMPEGGLDDLLTVIIEEGAALFVSAVGVPPKSAVDRLHKHGIVVMNMVGHPKHVPKALAVGVDVICAQGGEGGGHTGDVPTSILIPACVDAVRGKLSPLTGRQVPVVAAGGITDGRSLAAALMWGAQAVWVGTRFVASVEAGAPPTHKKLVVSAGFGDTSRTLIYSGRPMRVRKTDYVKEWEDTRKQEIEDLCAKGVIPHDHELESKPERSMEGMKWLMGENSSLINTILPAKTIVDDMVADAKRAIEQGYSDLSTPRAKL